MLDHISDLKSLWRHVDKIDKDNFPGSGLSPIYGGGREQNPEFMFVFINPTRRNISSDPSWTGPRFPFIGTKQVWRVFHKAGLFDDGLLSYIESNPRWSVRFTDKVRDFLDSNSIYISNVVKSTGADAALPDSAKINLFLPALQRELEIVKPKYLVAMGLIPFERLTGRKIKLADYHSQALAKKRLGTFKVSFGDNDRSRYASSEVIPCYFPVGRGSPKKAVELLRLLKECIR
ncbi:MAG: uracil-DNA glycosylase family protein [Nanoarchaeota archaeon]